MKYLMKVKTWLIRIGFLIMGSAAGVLGMALYSRSAFEGEKEEQSAEDYKREEDEFERMSRIQESGREEIAGLDDDSFDERYPSVPRNAREGGNRFVDRCRDYLQSRGSDPDRGSSDDDCSPGD